MSDWHIVYLDSVSKSDLARIDTLNRKRISQAIVTKLTAHPLHYGKPLRYSKSGQRSLRVGDYRVIYVLELEKNQVIVLAIGHRRDVYEA